MEHFSVAMEWRRTKAASAQIAVARRSQDLAELPRAMMSCERRRAYRPAGRLRKGQPAGLLCRRLRWVQRSPRREAGSTRSP